jgi:hypothetical protein
MHDLYDLKDKLLKELGEYSQNGKYSKDDVETIKYMASAIDHICNIVEREDEEYSQRGSYDNGNQGGYNRGYSRNSYRGRNGNSYARRNRDSMGRYSRGGDMVEQLEDLKQDAPNDQIRQQIQQLIAQVEQMM